MVVEDHRSPTSYQDQWCSTKHLARRQSSCSSYGPSHGAHIGDDAVTVDPNVDTPRLFLSDSGSLCNPFHFQHKFRRKSLHTSWWPMCTFGPTYIEPNHTGKGMWNWGRNHQSRCMLAQVIPFPVLSVCRMPLHCYGTCGTWGQRQNISPNASRDLWCSTRCWAPHQNSYNSSHPLRGVHIYAYVVIADPNAGTFYRFSSCSDIRRSQNHHLQVFHHIHNHGLARIHGLKGTKCLAFHRA